MRRFAKFFLLVCILASCAALYAAGADPAWNEEDVQLIFYGDSRTQGLAMCAGGCVYVGKTGAGYAWMSGEGRTLLQNAMQQYPEADIVFGFGVNDLGNAASYAQFFKDFKASYPERNIYFASVNPVADSYAAANGYAVRNASVEAFNAVIAEELPEYYIDTYTFLSYGGYDTVDGVHYGSDTYIEIQNLTKILVESMKLEIEAVTEAAR